MSLSNKVVLVTGAGGSIGSELCRHLVLSGVKKLILFDNSELALYNINRELTSANVVAVLGDITHTMDVGEAFYAHRPDIVFHVAAYKHVTLCEKNVSAAHRTNVDGTKRLVEYAKVWEVPKFVLVSTDKAVRPTSVMGYTKKVAEDIVRKAGFTVVRLGNVRGSSGSVLPLWREQIARGETVTVTDPNATRYMISSIEAARRIIEVADLPPGTYVPDMGRPERIGALALKMGATNFKVIGLRQGEKLHEELYVGGPVPTDKPFLFEDAA